MLQGEQIYRFSVEGEAPRRIHLDGDGGAVVEADGWGAEGGRAGCGQPFHIQQPCAGQP